MLGSADFREKLREEKRRRTRLQLALSHAKKLALRVEKRVLEERIDCSVTPRAVPFCIDRRRGQAGVPEVRLHVAHVCAAVEGVVDVGMAQPVGTSVAQIGRGTGVAGLQLIRRALEDPLEQAGNGVRRQSPAGLQMPNQRCLFRAFQQRRHAVGRKGALQLGHQFFRHGHAPVTAPLAPYL